jgi:hypothetical protein
MVGSVSTRNKQLVYVQYEKAIRGKHIYLAESGSWIRKWRSELDTFT